MPAATAPETGSGRGATEKLEFLGRLDHQVKLRGFRIELGEVEAALLACPGVREAVAAVRNDGPGERYLVAYAVAGEHAVLAPGELARSLARRLPAPFVPAAFVVLEALPRLPNGKVDRRALPAPTAPVAGQGRGAAPASPAEVAVARVWEEVLGREGVGRDDDFFRLGGHSLLGARVVSRLREILGVELPLRAVFESPTLAGLARRVATAAPAEIAGGAAPAAADRPVPLSFGQERLWFLDRLNPGLPLYNMPLALRLEGPLDPACLARALAATVRRHEPLRTRFASADGEPVQRVDDTAALATAVVDLSGLPAVRRRRAAAALRQGEARRPFDLGRPPLARALLLRLEARVHELALTLHHVAADGWSLGVLAAEVGALYPAFLAGRPSPLPPLPGRYLDFAARQRRSWQGARLAAELAHWRRELAGVEPLALPADRPRPPVRRYRGAEVPVALPAAGVARLEALARTHGATPFMAVLALFALLLHRLTGAEDVPVGSPVAGRDDPRWRDLIGFFVNTVVLRVGIDPGVSFRELLGRVRETTLRAYAHQEVPFEKLVEELAPGRDLVQTPLFQVVLALQTAPLERPRLPGVEVAELAMGTATAKFDLTLDLRPGEGGGLAGRLEYDADLYDAATVRRLARGFETLLAAALAAPERAVGALAALAPAERHQLVAEWSGGARTAPVAGSVSALVAAQAARRPEAVAVVAGGAAVSYGELVRRAVRLARHLGRVGVRRGDLVGVCLERSPELVATLLAVLQAGGAYLPLDPAYPESRLALMLEDPPTPPVVVTVSALVPALPGGGGGARVLLDDHRRAIEAESAQPPPNVAGEDDLAYVLYTSGSTGRPKGVAVSHGNVLRLVAGADFIELGTDETFLHLSPVAFDASTLELWGPLTSGGRLVLHPPELPSPAGLARLYGRERVTLSWLTAGLFHQVVGLDGLPGEGTGAPLAPLRHLLTGGEAPSPGAMRHALERHPGLLVGNGYGPTENTTFTAVAAFRSPAEVGDPVPLGRPIAGTTAFVLDAAFRPVPPGVAGELAAGGAGVARGYLARPAATAERFVPDPFGAAGSRLYRTGDLARFLPDGRLEFLGRRDQQVKLRGFRIELGEIEAALAGHPGIAAAAAAVRETGAGDRRLVAYAVARPGGGGPPPTAPELAAHLRERLPEFMVPAAFVLLDALPLTAHGKVDRRALPRPDWGAAAGEGRPPEGPTEELLAGLWRELLDVETVAAEDSFFDLGGHSLLATRLAARVEHALGVALPLRRIFEAPTLAELAAAVDEGRRMALPEAPPLEPRPRPGPGAFETVLSYAQRRLWFLERLEPGTSAYHVAGGLRLRGEALDLRALAGALRAVVARQAALRTSFAERQGHPVQVVHPQALLAMPVVDLAGLPPGRRGRALREAAAAEAGRPFDLGRPPLLRALVLREDHAGHALVLTLHHVVSDGWSVGVLVREVSALYRAAVRGEAASLPPVRVQYADYADWQREWLRGAALEARLRYWRRRLEGAPAVLELPADRPRDPARRRRAGEVLRALGPGLAGQVDALARSAGATPFMVLLAAFAALLGRVTGQDDLIVGAPVAGRRRTELEGLVGFFVNTLALRIDLSGTGGGPSYRELLARVRDAALDAFAHQDVPFEKVVEAVAGARDAMDTPLVQVVLALQTAPLERPRLPGVEVSELAVATGTAKFDLTLDLRPGEGGGLAGRLEYDADLYDAATVRRLLGGFETLLGAALATPGRTVGALPLLAPAEAHQLVAEWSGRGRMAPMAGWVHALVAAEAARRPEAVAVVAEGEAVTYGELARRSGRLARYLRRLGVRRGDLVGVCLERSPALVETLLAVLQAGGAYLPLDPAYPESRLALMLEDPATPPVVVTVSTLVPALPALSEGRGGPRVLLDAHRRAIEADPAGPGGPDGPGADPGDAGDLAFVLYTSGSTGRPKGVKISHGGVTRLLRGVDYVDLGPEETFSHSAPVAFDASTLEIWWPLASGGRLVLHPPELPDPEGIARLYARERVTVAFLTTGLFNQVARLVRLPGAATAPLASLRHLMTGGEAASPEAMRRVLARHPGLVLTNAYGPTENTTLATVERLRAPGEVAEPVPIGRAVTHSTCYLLDRAFRPVPPGVAGELCTGGAGVAQGYLARPSLTAERFVPDPFGGAGARLYRTGDLARCLADGRLEFLGRRDQQVKLRGFRIELGEVEAALASHPGIADAVAVVHEAGGGDRRLVAYAVARADAGVPPTAQELTADLRERLPEFMVPSALVFLDALPLAPSGKVDRRALPRPEWGAAAGKGRPPEGAAEELLAGFWRELLDVETVGAEDSFFELGGHSLLATQLVARVRAELGVELPVRRVFEAPTLAGLARWVEAATGSPAGARAPADGAPPLVPVAGDWPAPLSFAQERLWFVQRLDPATPAFHMPVTLRLRGTVRPEVLASALAAVIRRHDVLRTTFRELDGAVVQVVTPRLRAQLPLVDLTGLPAAVRATEEEAVVAREVRRPFDLARGPLFRLRLLQLEPDEYLLVGVLHHIVSDGWSIGVLLREMGQAWRDLEMGRQPRLPALPLQYRDVAVWQRRWLQGAALEGQLAYWRRALEGAPRVLDLPTDRPRPPVQTLAGASLHHALDPELTRRLRQLANERGASLFMVLLAGFGALLGRLAGQEELLVGSPIAGRTRPEMEGLVGCFLNTLVLRVDLTGAPSFDDLVARVRETALEAYAHQELPFERLLAELQPERDLSRTPLFQVFFNMLALPAAEIDVPEVTVAAGGSVEVGSKFDLTLYLDDGGEGVRLDLVYNPDLFDRPRMEELLAQYETLLARASAAPEEPLEHHSLATTRAREVLPDPRAPLDDAWHGSVHERFARYAREAPERVAVAGSGVCWSYGELAARTARLAAALAAGGVARGDVVAIWGQRSPALPRAVLAALRAGGAFTILDPAYPAARLARILERAAPRAFVEIPGVPVPEEVGAALDRLGVACRLRPEAGGPDRGEDLAPPQAGSAVGPDDLAYVAFTSGSTGEPKGVLGRHGPLSHFLPWQVAELRLGPDERYSLLSGLAHDPLQRDLFTSLATGGTLCVPDPWVVQAPGRLAGWMARERVSVTHLTPALGQVLTESAQDELPALRWALLVGDALTGVDVARIRKLAPAVRCINMFGSTETQRAVAWHRAEEMPGRGVLPLGRGIPGVQLLVLAGPARLAGIGEVGELAIRSPHLAAGYLADPELTRERFVPNPFATDPDHPADRVYRTGDLGRYRPDGEVEFLGRRDGQVKIRGFRVELGEIEAALRSLPGVREAVVLAWGEGRDRWLAAYVVPKAAAGELAPEALRAGLRLELPEPLVPVTYTVLDALPLTPNRKVDRRALPEPERRLARSGEGFAAPRTRLEEQVAAIWREVLDLERVGVEESFFDLGGHSLLLVRLHGRLMEAFGRDLPLVELFRHPTVRAQAERLAAHGVTETEPATAAPPMPARPEGDDGRIAVVAVAGRFPGARDVEELWHHLHRGVESIASFTDEELARAGTDPELRRHPRFVAARGVLDGVEELDAPFFGYTPRQAELTDPQHRLFLESCWQALERAGHDPARFAGRIGVYGGESISTYFLHHLQSRPDLLQAAGAYQTAIATDRDYLTTLVSYKLGLRGPSLAVQTACSTSLVAVHLACRALTGGECDLALAGGVSVKLPQVGGYVHEAGGIDSPDGHCRPFDARAAGTVWGSGVGVVALRRLSDALADGDPVLAVILGSAINNDGAARVGYSAPGADGQTEVVTDALRAARVPPDSVAYVEAHGTGTQLGDPIEVDALTRALGAGDGRDRWLGSVKSNLGHLGAAAGAAGLIKTVLALEREEIPPTVHFRDPNPAIDFAAGGFRVADRPVAWPRGEPGAAPRRAGVSSFGMGGTNAHVVLEEAPLREPSGPSRSRQILVLSARSSAAVERAAEDLDAWLGAHPEADLADVAHTLQVGRRAFPHRRAVVASDVEEARWGLTGNERRIAGAVETDRPPVAFLFPGQGAQHPGMGRDLYRSEAVFRRELDACAEVLAQRKGRDGESGRDLRELLFPEAGDEPAAARELTRTRWAQPALFAVEYALTRLLESWGVRPWALLGHSIGEYVAACLAEVFSLEDAVALVAFRGELDGLPPAGGHGFGEPGGGGGGGAPARGPLGGGRQRPGADRRLRPGEGGGRPRAAVLPRRGGGAPAPHLPRLSLGDGGADPCALCRPGRLARAGRAAPALPLQRHRRLGERRGDHRSRLLGPATAQPGALQRSPRPPPGRAGGGAPGGGAGPRPHQPRPAPGRTRRPHGRLPRPPAGARQRPRGGARGPGAALGGGGRGGLGGVLRRRAAPAPGPADLPLRAATSLGGTRGRRTPGSRPRAAGGRPRPPGGADTGDGAGGPPSGSREPGAATGGGPDGRAAGRRGGEPDRRLLRPWGRLPGGGPPGGPAARGAGGRSAPGAAVREPHGRGPGRGGRGRPRPGGAQPPRHPPGAAGRAGAPPLALPGADLDPGTDRGRLRRLYPPPGPGSPRGPRASRPGGGSGRARRPPRGSAHHLRRGRPPPGPGGGRAVPGGAAGRRPLRPPPGGPGPGDEPLPPSLRPPPLRPRTGSAAGGTAPAPRSPLPPGRGGDPPPGGRRLVPRPHRPGARGPLPTLHGGGTGRRPLTGAAGPVPGLRPLAPPAARGGRG